ncbi:MaoC family dehydratase [Rudaeicoccus suwonensis]|uniref:Acyl dehydratase n=1 Tax=Rudaeicoccus suwonensis TaxID=657409 RepID=A0A561E7I1_9MICO|nr:MaoC family dehydratase [Rudaeicoccus suwonensis]TWE11587.1 acyl dehydratase [Rudaeicoccus suwonensis]
MRTFNGIDELKAGVGEHLGYSDWHQVTQEAVNQFAEATGDHQWIHVDVDKAAAGPFGGTIAHGYMTLSLLPMLAGQVYTVSGVKMGINYGSNKVRFPTPVPVGSRVRGGFELVSVEPSSLGFTVTARATIEIEGGAKPACVAEILSVVVP